MIDFGQNLRNALHTGLLFLAILVGIQVSFLLAQVADTLAAWNDAAMRMNRTAQETLLTARCGNSRLA